jgi:hypothetical protein
MARVDYDQMAASYDRGRALTLETREGWRAALALAAAIATWFDTPVVAVERSAAMRRQAQQFRPHPRVAYLDG